nr:hypothetical protein CFP56_15140 [Quercus suber]
MQVVVSDSQTGNFAPTAVGGMEGRDRRINGEKQLEAKIPQGNKLRFPLWFNTILNSKQIASGTERDRRNYSWLRKGLIVEVKENCRRRVFWEHVKKGEQKSMWVSRGITAPISNSMGLGPSSLKAHKPLIGNNSYVGPKISSPSVFEAGDCSKKSHPGLGPSQCDLAVCPLSPGKEKVVVPSAMLLTCSEDSSLPPEVHVKPTMDTESIISELSLLPEEQMSVKNTHTFPEPMHVADVSQSPTVLVPSAVASIASPVAKDDGGEKKV